MYFGKMRGQSQLGNRCIKIKNIYHGEKKEAKIDKDCAS
jgi:hypothetical protein